MLQFLDIQKGFTYFLNLNLVMALNPSLHIIYMS